MAQQPKPLLRTNRIGIQAARLPGIHLLRLNVLLALVVLFAQTGCAQSKRGKQKALPKVAKTALPVLVVRLSEGPCMGRCIAYSASFFTPGRLEYTGRRNASRSGLFVYQLQDAFVKNMLLEIKKAKLMQLNERYPAPPDAPADTLYLYTEGRAKTIYYSRASAPPQLKEFANRTRENISAILAEQEPLEAPEPDSIPKVKRLR
jgi:hypothetical protein